MMPAAEAARARARTANAFTSRAAAGSDSAPSTSLYAAQLMTRSGPLAATASLTARSSVMSSAARVSAVTSESRPNTRAMAPASWPDAPVIEHPPSHQAARFVPATKAFIFSSSNTPSQRATTAVEMQLPITFTAVRPMSIT